jgi:hypothetical protein
VPKVAWAIKRVDGLYYEGGADPDETGAVFFSPRLLCWRFEVREGAICTLGRILLRKPKLYGQLRLVRLRQEGEG